VEANGLVDCNEVIVFKHNIQRVGVNSNRHGTHCLAQQTLSPASGIQKQNVKRQPLLDNEQQNKAIVCMQLSAY
jgi:hypothetical protein